MTASGRAFSGPWSKNLRIALTVENYEEALAFYHDALGLTLLEEWKSPGANGALLEAGRATLEIFRRRGAT
jgi:lactoylglutathione lyase